MAVEVIAESSLSHCAIVRSCKRFHIGRRSTMRTFIRAVVAVVAVGLLVWLPAVAQAGITLNALD